MADQQLSPRSALAVGLMTSGMGAVCTLLGLGVIPHEAVRDGAQSPPWIGVCFGLVFVLAGLLVILDYAIARVDQNGMLLPGTPWSIRATQYLAGLCIIGMMAAIATWVAFGSGERQFSTSVSVPFYTQHGRGNETGGRVIFGAAAVLTWLVFVWMGVSGAKGLKRDPNHKDS